MRLRKTTGISLTIVLLLLGVYDANASISNKKCKVEAKKKIEKKKEFICTSINGSLRWRQSVFPKSMVSTPIDQSNETYFKAYQEIEKAFNGSNPREVDIRIIDSQDANKFFLNLIRPTVLASARLWSKVYEPQGEFPIIIGNPNDVSWVQNEIEKYGHKFETYDLDSFKSQGEKASRGDVRINPQSRITFYVIGDKYDNSVSSSRSFISHEYVHAVQVHLFGSRERGIPHWAIEGSASFFGDAVSAIMSQGGLSEYVKLRKISARRDYPVTLALNSLTRDKLYEVLISIENNQDVRTCVDPKIVCYTAGAILTEKLVADYGFEKFVKWWILSSSIDWYLAFEQAFGINLDEWYQEYGIPYIQITALAAIPEEKIPVPNTYTPRPKRI